MTEVTRQYIRISTDVNGGELHRNKLPDQILDKLMEWIMSGKLSMGEKMNTEELAAQLGVSRMPIREALNHLEKKGLAESIPYVGTRLISLTEEDVWQIYMVRMALEPLAAKYACLRITEEDLDEIKNINDMYRNLLSKESIDGIELYQVNRMFHFAIYRSCRMERICSIIESLWDSLSFFKLIYGKKILDSRKAREDMIAEHQSYVDLLEKRDGEALYQEMQKNIRKRVDNIPYYSGGYFQGKE